MAEETKVNDGETLLFEAPPICERESNENFKPSYTLTEEEKGLQAQFRTLILEDTNLTEKQKLFCTDACLCRYLRAREWNLKLSHALLLATLKWRDSYGVENMDPSGPMAREMATGKLVVHGLDKLGRPILWMRPRLQNTKTYEEQTRNTVYMIERCVRSMDPTKGVEKLLLVLDFNGYSMHNAPPMSQSKEVLFILMDHFPERLACAIVIDAPRLFSWTYAAMSPFVPPETKKKILFISGTTKPGHQKHKLISSMIDMDIVPKEYGGNTSYEYDFDTYWGLEETLFKQKNEAAAA